MDRYEPVMSFDESNAEVYDVTILSEGIRCNSVKSELHVSVWGR